jgi:hypothetical protein
MKNSLELVRDFSIDQAKFYLEASKEFYPFGTVLKHDGTLNPVGIDLGGDYPDINEMIKVMEKSIIQRIKEGEIVAGAVGVDIFLNSEINNKRISAIEIRTLNEDNISKTWHLPYVIVNEDVFYKDLSVIEGSLSQ